MISVLVLGSSDRMRQPVAPGDVVRTLAALVPATIEGIVRDVCLLASGMGGRLADVADHAGCGFVEAVSFAAALERGARQARCSTVLVARAGMMLDRSFIDAMAKLLPGLSLTARQPGYRLKAEPDGFIARMMPALAADAALLTSRDALLAAHRTEDFRSLVRAVGPRGDLRCKSWFVVEA